MGADVLQEEMEVAGWPEFPWLTILFQPRKTIRAIVDSDENRYVILLVILFGIAYGLGNAVNRSYGDVMSGPAALIFAAIAGPVGALIGWLVGGAFFRWTGSWFGGVATTEEVRTAMAWSGVPTIATLPIWLVMLMYYGLELFYSADTPQIDRHPSLLLIGGILITIFTIWWYFLFWKCFAEVQRLSLIKSFAAIAIPFVVLVGIFVGCGLLTSIG